MAMDDEMLHPMLQTVWFLKDFREWGQSVWS